MTALDSFEIQTKADHSNMVALFKRHAGNCAHPPRVFFEDRNLSYPELDKASDVIADFLQGLNLPAEARVCVLLPRSLEAIISQLGILKAGGVYMPMSPEDFPIERLCAIFEDARVEVVITDSRYQGLCQRVQEKLGQSLTCYLADHQETDRGETHASSPASGMQRKQAEEQHIQKTITPDAERLAYVMYTSGSTGKPKGVMITQQNIICSVTDTDYFTLEKEDALLHAAPISFDAATFEIWAALLNGKDLFIVPEKIVHQFDAFADFVNSRPVTIAWLTSALFNLLADTRPAFFKPFKQILVGGEALSPRHINLIRQRYPDLILRNNYGPTENTIFSTSFLIDQNYQTNIPIGRAIRHKRAYILDEEFQLLPAGQEGELFVAGQGLSPGYLNLAEENRRRFLSDPFYPQESMYATGDICRYNEQGDIEFIGRKDQQVKVSGHRIELGDIETALQACPQVKTAVVLHKAVNAVVTGLVAYLKGEQVNVQDLKAQLAEKLPLYMIPVQFEIIDAMPLTVNGKIDRQLMQSWSLNSGKRSFPGSTSIQDTVLNACSEVLGRSTLDSSQNFFELGGDSLSGTSLMLELEQQIGISLPLQILYEHPCIADLSTAIGKLLSGDKLHSAAAKICLADEAKIHESIRLDGRTIHQCTDLKASGSQLFLTGATGFFGAFLLKELLDSTTGRIHCLVRARDALHAKQRLLEKFREYKIPVSTRQVERITGIPGDLSQPNMGLAAEQYAFLANNMDVIFHNGAAVNYVDTYATLKGPNVIGTQEVLKLSCHARVIPVHYISSVSVFETLGYFTGKQVIYENESVDISEQYVRLGYSQSKWVAEKMMENARSAGLPVNIYRSGYIMGHSETGVSNTTDHIARYIAGCIEMACAPILQEYASLSPVDQLSRAFCHVALNLQTYGQTFHLCNPHFNTVEEIYRKILAAGFPLELLPYAQWKQRLKRAPSSNPLYPLLSLHVHAAPNHSLTLPELYEHNTRFDCSHFLAELEGSGIRINLNTPNLFERWLNDYLRKGLISEAAFNRANTLDCIA